MVQTIPELIASQACFLKKGRSKTPTAPRKFLQSNLSIWRFMNITLRVSMEGKASNGEDDEGRFE